MATFNETKLRLEELDDRLLANTVDGDFFLTLEGYGVIGSVYGSEQPYQIKSVYGTDVDLSDETKSKIFDILTELARTPLNDRYDVRLFQIRHRYLDKNRGSYFAYYPSDETFYLDTYEDEPLKITMFTQEEMINLRSKVVLDDASWEFLEVEPRFAKYLKKDFEKEDGEILSQDMLDEHYMNRVYTPVLLGDILEDEVAEEPITDPVEPLTDIVEEIPVDFNPRV